jgi:hypothetical protein
MLLVSARRMLILLGACTSGLRAQTPEDGFLMPRRALGMGVTYAHDSWKEYWEGELKRTNGNIGTLTTRSVAWMAVYGVTGRLTVLATVPYVWTSANQGTSRGLGGIQDLTVVAKLGLLVTPLTESGELSAIAVAAATVPASNYSPDILPFSIGLGCRRASGRLTLSFQSRAGWFVNGSAAYTWRDNVTLDRPAYFTENQLYLADEVAMPAVFDYAVSVGYRRGRLTLPLAVSRQRTLGGGDIRRQDAPFVSNRMDFVRVEGTAMYALPVPLVIRVGVSRVVSGRNVGRSTTVSGGLMYLVRL